MKFRVYNLIMANSTRLDINDIRSVTDFQRNTKIHVARLRKTKAPMVLTVNGSAAVVMQDAGAYQKLIDHLEELEYEREQRPRHTKPAPNLLK